MSDSNILPFRPRPVLKTTPHVNMPLWSMRKEASRIECAIHDCGSHGWKAVFLINGDWFFSCRFDTWTAAIVAADRRHAELEQSGWSAEAPDGMEEAAGMAEAAPANG